MKRLISMVSVLVLMVLVLCGCSNTSDTNKSNTIPIQRKKDSYKDTIKFYGFKWLTEASIVLDKFNQDFGEDTYTIQKRSEEIEGTDLIEYTYYLNGKEQSNLNWIVAEHEVYGIILSFISNDNGEHCYLIRGTFEFSNDDDVVNDIRNKLKKIYTYDSKSDYFKDVNGNTVLPILGMFNYSCGEAVSIIREMENKVKDQKRIEEREKEKEEIKNQGL